MLGGICARVNTSQVAWTPIISLVQTYNFYQIRCFFRVNATKEFPKLQRVCLRSLFIIFGSSPCNREIKMRTLDVFAASLFRTVCTHKLHMQRCGCTCTRSPDVDSPRDVLLRIIRISHIIAARLVIVK